MAHECELCHRSFSRPWLLKRHRSMVHEETKLFECTECPPRFAQKHDLKSHEGTHRRQARYRCGGGFRALGCKKYFARLTTLKRHWQTTRGRGCLSAAGLTYDVTTVARWSKLAEPHYRRGTGTPLQDEPHAPLGRSEHAVAGEFSPRVTKPHGLQGSGDGRFIDSPYWNKSHISRSHLIKVLSDLRGNHEPPYDTALMCLYYADITLDLEVPPALLEGAARDSLLALFFSLRTVRGGTSEDTMNAHFYTFQTAKGIRNNLECPGTASTLGNLHAMLTLMVIEMFFGIRRIAELIIKPCEVCGRSVLKSWISQNSTSLKGTCGT